MNPLDIPCPKCGAKPTFPCLNYQGRRKAPCPARLGPKAPQHARSAAKKNKKLRDDLGMFADQVQAYTSEGEYWRWRSNKATTFNRSIEHENLLGWFQVFAARRLARRLLGETIWAELDAKAKRTLPGYPSGHEHHYGFWCDVLTGKRIELAMEHVQDRKPGEAAVRCTRWHEHEYMTADKFRRLFPYQRPEPLGEDDPKLVAWLEQFTNQRARRSPASYPFPVHNFLIGRA